MNLNLISTIMEFSQYLGFLAFLTIATIGFWLMMFLVGFVGYWVTGAAVELIKEKQAEKKLKERA
ncbi:hypothetical protein [Flavobacterium sp.]|uniref:hypothetical protein n=2 Tax=Flavobacterium sp. TaxID=239 RepID=UPI00403407B6